MPDSLRAQRKEDHLRFAEQSFRDHRHNDFDELHLVRPTLPQTSVNSDNLATTLFDKPVSAPFFINAMTGGTAHATEINTVLAGVAQQEGIAVAFGSASIVGHEPQALAGFVAAREQASDVPVLINVNPGTPLSVVSQLVEALEPSAVQVHVNVVQELVMREGDRDFHWAEPLAAIIDRVHDSYQLPVVVKEVGFGWDVASLRLAQRLGADVVDVAGSGGTNFAVIERLRREEDASDSVDYSWLEDSGLSTVQSLVNAQQVAGLTVFGSGGVRHPLDVVKCLVLGARAVGVSGVMLHTLVNCGAGGLRELISTWKLQLAGLFALYGAPDYQHLSSIPYWLEPRLEAYVRQIVQGDQR